jgi:hypothetical protein
VRAQLAAFANASTVPFARYGYDLVDDGTPLSHDGRWRAEVRVRLSFAGFESEPSVHTRTITFARVHGSWRVMAGSDFSGPSSGSPDLWDLGPVVVRTGASTLALAHPGHPRRLRILTAAVDAAVPRVTAIWGMGWSRRVVVEVPDSTAELSRLLTTPEADLASIAAVATAEIVGRHRAASGNRVLVNAPNFDQLGVVGRQVVLTHEVTHVASRAATGPAVPTWLVEGLADYVGYRDTGVSVRVAARELGRDVRAGRVPAALPSDADFRGSNPRLAQAYEGAWLAVRLIVDRTGLAGLLRLYRALGQVPTRSPAALRRILATQLHTTPESLTEAWRAALRAQLS